MSQRTKALCLMAFGVALMALPVLAQEGAQAGELAKPRADLFKLSLIVGGAVISLAVIAGAFCQSRAICSACEGISRNPAGAPAIRGLVLIETLVIYALLITIIILMVQWGKYV
jgi:F-type H+-transporting ATPase subunit c